MIVYALSCAAGHHFEAWFRDSAAFDNQRADGALSCPICGASDVRKAPMAPHVARNGRAAESRVDADADAGAGSPSDPRQAAVTAEAASFEALAELVTRLRRHVEAHCVDVGAHFADEARRMHYGETAHRGIYGEASAEEASALLDEGIAVEAIPWFVRRND